MNYVIDDVKKFKNEENVIKEISINAHVLECVSLLLTHISKNNDSLEYMVTMNSDDDTYMYKFEIFQKLQTIFLSMKLECYYVYYDGNTDVEYFNITFTWT